MVYFQNLRADGSGVCVFIRKGVFQTYGLEKTKVEKGAQPPAAPNGAAPPDFFAGSGWQGICCCS